ncbi:MAG: hypothetical protein DRJ61_03990 [Acidobacteria bacterium]|nr:MAG: hypothetical protein DRJ65_08410 [Acidobacteriota bacterium]RLE35042.1 MAG: hypothetical protein DRJ61_03990 [Acidobacteriota bacterium]
MSEDQNTRDQALPSASPYPPAADTPTWRPLIKPYLLKLASKVTDQGPKEHSISFPIGDTSILVSPLDQALALRAAENLEPEKPHHLLLLDALGMEILIAVARRKAEKSEGSKKTAAEDRLEQGLDFGYRISHAMTIRIRKLRDEGEMDAADEVHDSWRRLTSLIDEVEHAVKSKAVELEETPEQDRFVYQWDSSGATSGATRHPVKTSKTPTPSPPANSDKGRQHLVLAVLILVLGAVVTNLLLSRSHQLQDFSVEDFPKIPGIEQVINRSPVLLIVVSEREWIACDRYEKSEAIDSVRKIIEPAGYKRVEFRSRISGNLASWNGGSDIVITK